MGFTAHSYPNCSSHITITFHMGLDWPSYDLKQWGNLILLGRKSRPLEGQ